MLGFTDCTTNNECGAFYLNGHSITINNLCGYMCEAINNYYQLFNVQCDITHDLNSFTYLAISLCSTQNRGNSAISISGGTRYRITNINSSNNYNFLGDKSFGACFRAFDVSGFSVNYINFLSSTGLDIINTHFSDKVQVSSGNFQYGNIINCTTTYIYKFRGTNYVNNINFGNLHYSNRSFQVGATSLNGHHLFIQQCHFDVMPNDFIQSCVTIDASSITQNPLITDYIQQQNFDLCAAPSKPFSDSSFFTQSKSFSNSLTFTQSKSFTPSIRFSSSSSFSPSSKFTSSKEFSPSSEFTSSNHFSPSTKFSSSENFTPSKKFTSSLPFSPSSSFSTSQIFSRSIPFSPSLTFTRSNHFTSSSVFTESSTFSYSSPFTSSSPFSPSPNLLFTRLFTSSSEFTSSKPFSPSTEFSNSNSFLIVQKRTSSFTPSSQFTPSFTFTPNATKYPDGVGDFEHADVSGRNALDKPASSAAIGATAGVSFVFIVVAIALMLLYLRSKQRQMKGHSVDISEDFLNDSTESSSSSYSYSYYTYEEYSVTVNNDSQISTDEYSYCESLSYSGFDEDSVLDSASLAHE
ncbi:hypothetical protein M9Y10_031980 [Tritrichomonas musculus]|uniref:Uncharacterized protein n=1 Tax=Tritrichomonas musculus TaxID=1915356 RepID=A0ABR2H2A5_9EUKA